MNDADSPDPDRELRDKIARAMQSVSAPGKQVSEQERRELKSAAARLDRLLKSASDSDQQVLKDAVGRLDRLLSDIRTGKDLTKAVRRRSGNQDGSE
jgi:cell division septum initiation protein DivIVA